MWAGEVAQHAGLNGRGFLEIEEFFFLFNERSLFSKSSKAVILMISAEGSW